MHPPPPSTVPATASSPTPPALPALPQTKITDEMFPLQVKLVVAKEYTYSIDGRALGPGISSAGRRLHELAVLQVRYPDGFKALCDADDACPGEIENKITWISSDASGASTYAHDGDENISDLVFASGVARMESNVGDSVWSAAGEGPIYMTVVIPLSSGQDAEKGMRETACVIVDSEAQTISGLGTEAQCSDNDRETPCVRNAAIQDVTDALVCEARLTTGVVAAVSFVTPGSPPPSSPPPSPPPSAALGPASSPPPMENFGGEVDDDVEGRWYDTSGGLWMIAAVAVLFVLVSCNSAVLLNMLRKMQRLRREGVEQSFDFEAAAHSALRDAAASLNLNQTHSQGFGSGATDDGGARLMDSRNSLLASIGNREPFTRASLSRPRRITPLPSVVPTTSVRSLPLYPLPQPPATAPSPSPPSAAATTARTVPIVAGSAGDFHVANASATAPVALLPAVQPRPSADTGDPRPTPPQDARNEGDEDGISDLSPSPSLSYRCTECNRLFKSKTALRIHTYTRHGSGK